MLLLFNEILSDMKQLLDISLDSSTLIINPTVQLPLSGWVSTFCKLAGYIGSMSSMLRPTLPQVPENAIKCHIEYFR